MTDAQLSRLRECLLSTANYLSNAAYELEMFARELPRRKSGVPLEIISGSIEELELSVRSVNCLKKVGVNTIEDLVKLPRAQFKQIKYFGRRSQNEVNDVLKNLGFERK
jgi:DNA-directed RNA polymerase alpha subunit